MTAKLLTVLVVLGALLLLFGCTSTGTDTNTAGVAKVTNQKEASAAIDDVSTDIAGVATSLTSINNEFVDTNAP